MMKLENLIFKDECITKKLPRELEITNIAAYHKNIKEGSVFFHIPSLSGNRTEPDKILKKRPLAIVTEDSKAFEKCKIPTIEVKNARRALAYAMASFSDIDFSKTKFIGITGTNGKTTVATMLKTILEYSGKKCGLFGTGKILSGERKISPEKYTMTCPDPEILYPAIGQMQKDGCEIIIMEASSHALALDKLFPIPFTLGVFTGLSSEHMDFHKDMDEYLRAKERLIENAKSAIINIDDKSGKYLYEKYKNKSKSIGIIWEADAYATDVCNRGLEGCRYIYRTDRHLTRITLKIPGLYNIYNSLLATSAAISLGTTPKLCKEALASLEKIEGRMEVIRDDITVIIDYAHTPFALQNLLKTAFINKKIGQNIILVFGCGGERDKEKRPDMASVAERYASKTIVTADNSRGESLGEIISDITAGFSSSKYGVITDRAAAIRYAIQTAAPDDIVIIAGKGHERYILDENGYHSFDEREIVKDALKSRKDT